MDYLGIAGFVFAATAVSVLVYEHQADVLHGPYIEGRAAPQWVEPQWAADILQPLRELFELDPQAVDAVAAGELQAIDGTET